jgi:hypothetical protein
MATLFCLVKMEGGSLRTKEKVCYKRNFNEIESVAFW